MSLWKSSSGLPLEQLLLDLEEIARSVKSPRRCSSYSSGVTKEETEAAAAATQKGKLNSDSSYCSTQLLAEPEAQMEELDSLAGTLQILKKDRGSLSQDTVALTFFFELLRSALFSLFLAAGLNSNSRAAAFRLAASIPQASSATSSPAPSRADEEASDQLFWSKIVAPVVEATALPQHHKALQPSQATSLQDYWKRITLFPIVSASNEEVAIMNNSACIPHLVQDEKDSRRDIYCIEGEYVHGSQGFANIVGRITATIRNNLQSTPRRTSSCVFAKISNTSTVRSTSACLPVALTSNEEGRNEDNSAASATAASIGPAVAPVSGAVGASADNSASQRDSRNTIQQKAEEEEELVVVESLLLLHLLSRTYTGGCSVDYAFPLFANAPRVLLVPLPRSSFPNQLIVIQKHATTVVQLHAHTQYRLHVSETESIMEEVVNQGKLEAEAAALRQKFLNRVVLDVHWFAWIDLSSLAKNVILLKFVYSRLLEQVRQNAQAHALWESLGMKIPFKSAAETEVKEETVASGIQEPKHDIFLLKQRIFVKTNIRQLEEESSK